MDSVLGKKFVPLPLGSHEWKIGLVPRCFRWNKLFKLWSPSSMGAGIMHPTPTANAKQQNATAIVRLVSRDQKTIVFRGRSELVNTMAFPHLSSIGMTRRFTSIQISMRMHRTRCKGRSRFAQIFANPKKKQPHFAFATRHNSGCLGA